MIKINSNSKYNFENKFQQKSNNIIEFKSINDYKRGILYEQLVDAYSFDIKFYERDNKKWIDYDNFFFDNSIIAEKYGFITTLNGVPIGHITWDPRNRPEFIIGHNCIITKYKGKGYGKIQLIEAIRRIISDGAKIIKVSTNEELIPAVKNYESVGFKLVKKIERYNHNSNIDSNMFYEMVIRKGE